MAAEAMAYDPPNVRALEIADEAVLNAYHDGCAAAEGSAADRVYAALTDAREWPESQMEAKADQALADAVASLDDNPPPVGTVPAPEPGGDRGECETEANPVACQPPPDPATVTVGDPEPPVVTVDVEHTSPPVIPEGQDPDRQQADGPVVLGAPVKLGAWAEHLCPPEDVWARGGFTGCGDYETDGDYLHSDAPIFRDCYHPPVRLGIGDRYISAAVTGTAMDGRSYVIELDREIVGFNAPDIAGGGMWAWVTARVTSTETYILDNPDGSTERLSPRPPVTGTVQRWAVLGGEAGRTLAADGTLASGLVAVHPGRLC